MALRWFGGGREATLPELIAQKRYGRAIELLREQFKEGSRDPRMRMQLADVLVSAGRTREAIPVYLGLVDDFAHEGFLAKAIALLKKIERVDPGRPDVERRMTRLATQPRPEAALPLVAPESGELGIEELGFDTQTISVAATTAAPPPLPAVAAVASGSEPSAGPQGNGEGDQAEFEEEFFEALEETVTAASQSSGGLDLESVSPKVASPLFGDFSDDELLAVMRKLELQIYEPGDIIVSEGEPGASLFVLTTGVVKAFVRDPGGRSVMVREMGEGAFFGEISILSGKPRTATVTCATSCELLELDRAALDEIAAVHPHVHQVLVDFYRQRAGSEAEKVARQGGDQGA
jgi:hypothetical protein